MSDTPAPSPILADQPEMLALGQLAAVSASKIAAAFSDPENFFDHLSLDELGRIRSACARFAEVQVTMAKALDVYAIKAREILASRIPAPS